MFLHQEIVDHIRYAVTPRIRHVLQEMCPDSQRNLDGVLSWEEEAGYTGPLERYSLLYWPIPSAPGAIPVIAALISIIGFFLTIQSEARSPLFSEYVLLIINGALCCYVIAIGYLVGRRTSRTSDIYGRARNRVSPNNIE
jgi:hypothetical protein